eukprot:3635501-Amphidinium_carterae.1
MLQQSTPKVVQNSTTSSAKLKYARGNDSCCPWAGYRDERVCQAAWLQHDCLLRTSLPLRMPSAFMALMSCSQPILNH